MLPSPLTSPLPLPLPSPLLFSFLVFPPAVFDITEVFELSITLFLLEFGVASIDFGGPLEAMSSVLLPPEVVCVLDGVLLSALLSVRCSWRDFDAWVC